MLADADKEALLRLARETVESTVRRTPPPAVAAPTPALLVPGGAFVTLSNRGRLRGCIGTFAADAPLAETVRKMAKAALRDPRFLADPVTPAELRAIDIEVSALGPLEKLADPLREIDLGRHGIRIDGPHGSGCFLPQVATETGWSLEEFLANCCAGKAGMAPDAWRRPEVNVYRFEADVFGEKQ